LSSVIVDLLRYRCKSPQSIVLAPIYDQYA
jgi:hypothetical protein